LPYFGYYLHPLGILAFSSPEILLLFLSSRKSAFLCFSIPFSSFFQSPSISVFSPSVPRGRGVIYSVNAHPPSAEHTARKTPQPCLVAIPSSLFPFFFLSHLLLNSSGDPIPRPEPFLVNDPRAPRSTAILVSIRNLGL